MPAAGVMLSDATLQSDSPGPTLTRRLPSDENEYDSNDDDDRGSKCTSESSEWNWCAINALRADCGGHSDAKRIPDGAETLSQLSVHAALGQHIQLKHLLRKGAQPNELDLDRDRRPLHWAAARGQLRCVELLIANGADPEQPDKSGLTPLQLAVRSMHNNVAFLLQHGSAIEDPRRVSEGVLTPASLQAALNQPQCLKQKLRMRLADPNTRDNDGDRTPLHWACARGFVRPAQLLIEAGASMEALDAEGHTPAELAFELRQPETYNLLLEVEEERRLRLIEARGKPTPLTALRPRTTNMRVLAMARPVTR